MFSQFKYVLILCLLLAGVTIQPTMADSQNASKPVVPVSSAAQKSKVAPVYDEAAMLRAQNNRLRKLVINLNQRITDAQNNKWVCAEPGEGNFNLDHHLSVTKAGATQDCTPYRCGYVSGQCLTYANNSDDCAAGYSWVDGGKCIHQ